MNLNNKESPAFRLYLILAYLAVYIVWGTTFLANLYALEGFRAFQLSGFRFVIAGIILLCLSPIKRLYWPSLKEFKVLSVSGILMLVGGSGLVVYAEEYIGSGYAAVLVATEPLWFVVLDRARWRSYFSNINVISGLLIGFSGVVLFIYFTPTGASIVSAKDQFKGTCIVLVSCVLWVVGTLYARKHTRAGDSTGFRTAIQLFAAGAFAFLLATFRGEWSGFSFEAIPLNAWAGMLYLIVFGSLVAFLAFNWLITVQPPALVSTHSYVNPVVAILVGWLMADEHVAAMQIVALVVVLSGILLAQLKGKTVGTGIFKKSLRYRS